MNWALIPGSEAVTVCTGVTLQAPLLNIVSCLEPPVPLQDHIQGLVDPSDLLIVHHVVWSQRCSLSFKVELFGLLLIFCWWTPSPRTP
jgi:hypothetical protein